MALPIEYQSTGKERLDKFLAQLFACSREKIQRLINENKILVNNQPAKQSYLLRQGDKIENLEESVTENQLDKLPYFPLKLEVVKEASDYLIINKPAGLVVHPLRSLKEKTLVTALLNFYPEIRNIGDNPLRPGIVHRLDKDVSGLMLVAKTQRAFDYFKNEFKKHRIQKEYLALVHGQPVRESGVINAALAKKGAKTILAKKIDLKKIKESWTEYEIIKRINADISADQRGKNQRKSVNIFTLLKVKILTGRTHQIRIHLKSIGHPIVGDKKYKIKRQKRVELNRIFLHSHKLGFYDLSGEWQEFQIDPPIELKNFLLGLEK